MLSTYIYNYIIYLLASLAMIGVFSLIYTKITPYDELKMIREGQTAAACSFVGALLGFSLTLASSIMHNDNLVAFAGWASAAMAVQLLVYALVSRIMPEIHNELDNNNVAMGALLGGVSLTFGIINAACLSQLNGKFMMGFVAGTLVHTDKCLVPIEQLKVEGFRIYFVGKSGILVAAQK